MTLDEIKPFGDRILVRPDPKHGTSEGGIVIPETVNADNPNMFTMTGTVLKLGDGYREDVYECLNQQCRYQSRRTVGEYCPVCKATQALAYADSGRHAFDVQVGDRVLFGRFAGREVEVTALVDAADPVMIRDGMWYTPQRTDKSTMVLMREVEVLGILDHAADVRQVYEAPKMGKVTKGLTPEVTQVPR
jgi:co-chaperonin GroES (HSP10)